MPNLHKCSICGKVDFWAESWSNYSSILIDDYDSRLSIRTCSKTCEKESKARISDGRIVLPEVGQRAGIVKLTRLHKGYERQPEQEELLREYNLERLREYQTKEEE